MDQVQDIEASAPAASRPGLRGRVVLWLHRLAERHDLLPADFGDGQPVDLRDGEAVRQEWIRHARRWADDNPEKLLAWKAGGVALGGALLVLVVIVGAIG